MRYLVKHIKISNGSENWYVSLPANVETADPSLGRQFNILDGETVVDGIRRVYELGPQDEVIVDLRGVWDNSVVDQKVKHPFMEDVLLDVPLLR